MDVKKPMGTPKKNIRKKPLQHTDKVLRKFCNDLQQRCSELTARIETLERKIAREAERHKTMEADAMNLNRDLKGCTAKLEAANRDMESFSSSASHDLRSPLISIDGFSRILLEDYADKLNDKGTRMLHIIRDNAKKMTHLMNDVLAFSRVSTKEIKSQDVNMEAVARKAFEEIRPAIGQRNVRLKIASMPPAYGDLSMIRQVLVNLLSNAVKFTHSKEPALIEMGGNTETNENIYFVKDNGIGFDPQFSGRLFGLCQKLHGPKKIEGSGVGLAIVQRIITKHGGRIWAIGKPDEGATFYFALPRKASDKDC
jgi:light-regulated signal transduction histidine kinase (bacteriophytochrome)